MLIESVLAVVLVAAQRPSGRFLFFVDALPFVTHAEGNKERVLKCVSRKLLLAASGIQIGDLLEPRREGLRRSLPQPSSSDRRDEKESRA